MTKYYIYFDSLLPIRKTENGCDWFWDDKCKKWGKVYYADAVDSCRLGIDYGIEIPEHLALLWIAYD